MPETAKWAMYVCETPTGGKDVQGVDFLPGALALPAIPGGSALDAGSCLSHNSYDATDYLDEAKAKQSGFTPLHLDELWTGKAKTGQSAYVVSCYTVEYAKFPSLKGPNLVAKSHDWFLVLKAGDLSAWPAHLEHHLLGTALVPGTAAAPGGIGQGVYDLSGDNGCAPDPDMDPDVILHREDKGKSNPIVIVPGFGSL